MSKDYLSINIRISTDETGKSRFTKDEVMQLMKENKVKFSGNLMLRIGDGKVIGEITY